MEESPELGEGHNTTIYRELDARIGRWWSVDPKAELYYSWSPYNLSADNPIANTDPSGATVVDPKGNPVDISIGDDNKLSYSFSKNYSDKQLSKIKKHFESETAPILETMAKTESGRKDIQTLNEIPTLVTLYKEDGSDPLVNSWVEYGEIQDNGYFDKVTITPFLGNHKTTGSQSDFDEWLGATMTVEVGHLEKEQAVLDKWARESNPNYLKEPKSKEFQTSYKPLLNRATSFRIQYRIEKEQPITKEVFKSLDKYSMEYSEENKKAREKFDNQ